jgi:hypothetical protein
MAFSKVVHNTECYRGGDEIFLQYEISSATSLLPEHLLTVSLLRSEIFGVLPLAIAKFNFAAEVLNWIFSMMYREERVK